MPRSRPSRQCSRPEMGTVLLQVGGGASVRAKVLDPDKVLLSHRRRRDRRAPEQGRCGLLERTDHGDGSLAEEGCGDTRPPRAQMNEINKRIRIRLPAGNGGRARFMNKPGLFLMFGGLRDKLRAARERLAAVSQAGECPGYRAANPPTGLPATCRGKSRPLCGHTPRVLSRR